MQRLEGLDRCRDMRLVIALALLAGSVGMTDAAQPHWLSSLLGLGTAPAQHAAARTRTKAAGPAPAPAPRPADLDAVRRAPANAPSLPPPATDAVPLPQSRPQAAPPSAPAPEPATSAPPHAEPEGNGESGPQSRAPRVFETACPAVVLGQVKADTLPPIAQQQCVARSPLSLEAVMVNGHEVAIAGGVTSDCAMASMLPMWLGQVDGYLWSRLNTRLEAITVGTSFMCRDRRTGETNDTLSEHAFADALDITSFTLENGRTVSVASGWMPAESEDGRMLRFTHDAACALFMTTLGPEANALHHDHFHIDMGCHGKDCTFRMCE
jgi:hypothetical protein